MYEEKISPNNLSKVLTVQFSECGPLYPQTFIVKRDLRRRIKLTGTDSDLFLIY